MIDRVNISAWKFGTYEMNLPQNTEYARDCD